MDPKVLTLFDDDDFQPPPPRPKAGKKAKVSNEHPVITDVAAESGADNDAAEGAAQDENQAEPIREETVNESDIVLDQQMRAALIQADYTQYVYKEMPAAQLQQPVIGSGIVFEGVTERKKTTRKTAIDDSRDISQMNEVEPVAAGKDEGLPEWQLESRYYSIGEVAKLFGVNNSHIRFWTTQFKLKPRTTRKGDRLYNVDDINQLRLIHHLVKEKKHTIKGAKEKLKDKDVVEVQLDLKTSLTKLKDILTEMRDKL